MFTGIQLSRGWRRRNAVIVAGLASLTASAQDILPSFNGGGSTQPAFLPNTGVYQAPPLEASGTPPLMHWGELALRPKLDYRFLYGDGIPVSTNHNYTTAIQSFAPGMLLEFGSQWTLLWTPTELLYSNNHFTDVLNQEVVLRGGVTNSSTAFSVQQSYAQSTSPNVETGGQTEAELYSTTLSMNRAFNSRWSLEAGIDQRFRFTSRYQGFRDWSTLDWMSYQLTPRLNLALGLGGGYTEVIGSVNSIYEQANGRVNWRLSDRFSLGLSAGAEERELQQTGGGQLFNPLFSASVGYQMTERTRFSLAAARTISVSYIHAELTETTTLQGSLTEQLAERWRFIASAAYFSLNYVGTELIGTGVGTLLRQDSGYSMYARLTYSPFNRGTVALLTNYRESKSSDSIYSLSGLQFGFELRYDY